MQTRSDEQPSDGGTAAPSRAPSPETPLGIVINPMSGRDARRLFARAMSSTPESKRNQVERIIVGAASAGVRKIVLARDPFRVADGAVEALGVDVEIEMLDVGASCKPADTVAIVERMRDLGCGALAVLGGDGTSRLVSTIWPDVTLLPLSTGTNNVFPMMIEATVAGAAVGMVAAGRAAARDVAPRAKVVRVDIEGEPDDLALIDAGHVVDDHPGSLLPYEPSKLRTLVLSRALPAAVGMSPIGGLLMPCSAEDDHGVVVHCVGPEEAHAEGAHARALLAPISPGLYRTVHVTGAARAQLGQRIELVGPGLLEFDGDRERTLEPGQRATLRVERDGPYVVDPARALMAAAEAGVYVDRGHFHDHRNDAAAIDCC